jgi:hypothetical protein
MGISVHQNRCLQNMHSDLSTSSVEFYVTTCHGNKRANSKQRSISIELDAAKHAGFYNQTNGHVRDYDFKGSSEERRREKISAASKDAH